MMSSSFLRYQNSALIGHTGFVGSALGKQLQFSQGYNSKTICDVAGRDFEFVICAGAPGQKWLANKEPALDKQNIANLISNLRSVACRTFVLISTIDVFKNPNMVNEETPVDETDLCAYGSNRYVLENFIRNHFENSLIVRLPGLVGPGLRKNVIFDLLNGNNLNLINSRNVYQFYPIVNLWFDIVKAINLNLSLVHLTAEPISVSEVASLGMGIDFSNPLSTTPVNYDFRSRYVKSFGGGGLYHYSKKETISAIRNYYQTEPKTDLKVKF